MSKGTSGKPQIVLTPEQLDTLKQLAMIKLPIEQCAHVLKISGDTLTHLIKNDDTVNTVYHEGASSGSRGVRATLFQMAMGKKPKLDPQTGVVIETGEAPDFQALKFWCQTQEGFKSADRIEVTGADGQAIQFKNLSPDEAAGTAERILERIKARASARKPST